MNAQHSKTSPLLEKNSLLLHLPAPSSSPLSLQDSADGKEPGTMHCSVGAESAHRGHPFDIQPSSSRDLTWNPTSGALLRNWRVKWQIPFALLTLMPSPLKWSSTNKTSYYIMTSVIKSSTSFLPLVYYNKKTSGYHECPRYIKGSKGY